MILTPARFLSSVTSLSQLVVVPRPCPWDWPRRRGDVPFEALAAHVEGVLTLDTHDQLLEAGHHLGRDRFLLGLLHHHAAGRQAQDHLGEISVILKLAEAGGFE
jgi:hypothetical protein